MTEVIGEYNKWLIILSYITAVLAAYTALDLSERVVHTKGWKNKGWLFTGSLTMGLGIWSMHFIGMEAMESISIVYNPVLYGASFAIAITASFAALKLSFVLAKKTGSSRILSIKIGSAFLMGGAISGMHYTGMAAATLYKNGSRDAGHPEMDTVELGIVIVLITLMLQGLMILGAFTDKRLLIQAEKVKDNEERFQSLIKHNIDPIYVFSLEGDMLFANSSGYSLLNQMRIEPIQFSSVLCQEDHEKLLSWFLQVKSEKKAINRDTQITASNVRFDLNLTLIPVYVRQELDSIYVICKDMTKQREAERKIRRMAHYDALTDLPNRRYAVEHLANVLNDKHSGTAVLFLDLNRFKIFNDALGHNIGDRLLIEASKRLAKCMPDQGFIARLGGDEFIIITPAYQIDELSEQLIRQFESVFRIKDHRLKTSVSIGIAVSPADGTDGEELMKKADMAMYAAKDKNRSRYQYFSSSIGKQSELSLKDETE
ncbi:diguanylate cyclase [Bacillus swezeyi]|uniref:diguanylate cyclase domain-containing protein n=1 Tax=Bacillus swezeyi TaxID=1925020 RepID=UPI0009772AB6|nr:diguanylate cyclase [Bacillus swezeyi]OMI24770.1 diguanylate cyclase [Bacillus swezeyi]